MGTSRGFFRHKTQTERPQSQLGTRLQAEVSAAVRTEAGPHPQGRRENRVSASETEVARKNTQAKQTAARGQQAAGRCGAPLTISGEKPLLGEQQQTVDTAPDHKMQRSAVPQTAQKKDRQRVQSTAHSAAPRTAQRNVEIIGKPAGQADMPPVPEIAQRYSPDKDGQNFGSAAHPAGRQPPPQYPNSRKNPSRSARQTIRWPVWQRGRTLRRGAA